MNSIRKLCVLSAFYQSENDPMYAFVGTLVEAIADMGVECHVISPVSIIEKKHCAQTRVEMTAKGNKIHVYCPKFIVFPYRKIGPINTFRWTMASKIHSVNRTYRKYVKDCDAFYSHFIATSGIHALQMKGKTGIPAFVALGESNITRSAYAYELYRGLISDGFNGVITVSSDLKKEVGRLRLISDQTPMKVFPNAIDTDVFYPHDRAECRRRLNVAEDDFVVAFVGGYIKRKGFGRLQRVIARHPEWKCILIGAGEEKITLPEGQVLFSGRVSHDRIPEYLGAADVFALPTLEEGCCNAIIEAMGCGLPVASSNRSFNDDILDDTCSVRFDPENEEEIDAALTALAQDQEQRIRLGKAAFHAAQKLSITRRAQCILEFMQENM